MAFSNGDVSFRFAGEVSGICEAVDLMEGDHVLVKVELWLQILKDVNVDQTVEIVGPGWTYIDPNLDPVV